jgi:hypothetical protein
MRHLWTVSLFALVLIFVLLLGRPKGVVGQSCGGGGGAGDCTVSLYTPATSCNVSGTSVTLKCAWGGPNTCCNPSIKASENANVSGASCSSISSYYYISGAYQITVSCCNPVTVNSNCDEFVSGAICSSSIKVG